MNFLEINTIFFDMDGVLIDSEPFWKKAEFDVFKKQFDISLSEKDLEESMGLKTTEVVALHTKKFDIQSIDVSSIGFEIEKRVVEQIIQFGKPKEGLYELLEWVNHKKWRRALVTSSSHFIINAVLDFLKLNDFFESKFSAYDELKGKPDPAVYLSALKYFNCSKEQVIVIEDSKNGLRAAKSAGLNVLSIPDQNHENNMDFFHENALGVFENHFQIQSFLSQNLSK